ncbi:MAG: prepilin peptidase [Planctomycetes bacterium]|nr:prepilin peptidase [Planctomycetota bacterium]
MVLFDAPLWLVLPFLFALGAVLGSFLNVCAYRIPQHERLFDQLKSLTSPPSSCPHCAHPILRRDNVPVLSWLMLGGRCRYCRGRISPRYPLVELANGLLFVAVYLVEVPGGWRASLADSGTYSPLGPQILAEGLSAEAWLHWRYAYHMVLMQALVVATLIDFDTFTIPDASTLPAMAVGVLGAAAIGQVFLVPLWFQDPVFVSHLPPLLRLDFGSSPVELAGAARSSWVPIAGLDVPQWVFEHPRLHGLAVSMAGLLVGGGLVWGLRILGGAALGEEAMGFGDVVLMATIGSFLGWQPTIVAFIIAPVFALAVHAVRWLRAGHREIPFGPYLSLGALVVLLGWRHIWPVARNWFAWGAAVVPLAMVMGAGLFLSLWLVRLVKRGMGLAPRGPHVEIIEEWTPADQHLYLQGENADLTDGHLPRNGRWPGIAAARGTAYDDRWRTGGGD